MRFLSVCVAAFAVGAMAYHPTGGIGTGYSLGVRDSFMIAHSFKGEQFGPAQQLHGATYTVDAEFKSDSLVPESNWVIDIGAATDMLAEILANYNFKNLDEVFPMENTTTEFMCKVIFDEMAAKCKGFHGSLCIKLWESHKAWACYQGDIGECGEGEDGVQEKGTRADVAEEE